MGTFTTGKTTRCMVTRGNITRSKITRDKVPRDEVPTIGFSGPKTTIVEVVGLVTIGKVRWGTAARV